MPVSSREGLPTDPADPLGEPCQLIAGDGSGLWPSATRVRIADGIGIAIGIGIGIGIGIDPELEIKFWFSVVSRSVILLVDREWKSRTGIGDGALLIAFISRGGAGNRGTRGKVICDLGFRVLECRVLGFRVLGLGLRVYGLKPKP
jgi:hypothetical protein